MHFLIIKKGGLNSVHIKSMWKDDFSVNSDIVIIFMHVIPWLRQEIAFTAAEYTNTRSSCTALNTVS